MHKFSPNNQHGAALIMVLMVLTIFSILGLTIIGATITNMKQFTKTEDDIQTTDLAEMGLKYYLTSFDVYYKNQRETQMQKIIDLIESDKADNSLQDSEDYETILATNFADDLNNAGNAIPSSGDSLIVKQDDQRSFEIIVEEPFTCITCDSSQVEDGEEIEFKVKSEGTMGSETKAISATIIINIGKISLTSSGGTDGDTGGSTGPVDYGTIVVPPNYSSYPLCTAKTFGSTNCQTTGDISLNKPSSIIDAKIYIDGNISSDKTLNQGIVNSTLYVTGSATFEQPINGIYDSKIYVGHDAQFKNINGIGNSIIVIRGNADFNDGGNITGLTESSIYVEGNADFHDKHINSFDSSAKICVGGVVTNTPTHYPNIYASNYNADQLDNECGNRTITIGDNVIQWDVDTSNIEYQYN